MKTTNDARQNKLQLKFGFGDYDRYRPLVDGTVKIEHAETSFETAQVITEIFEKMIRYQAFDVSEMGMSYFLRVFDLEDCPFIAIPVFPVRVFRHSAIYINNASGIKTPGDLAGKKVGELALYGHDAGVWPKGILADEFNLTPEQCSWTVGKLDWPISPTDYVTHPHPANVEVNWPQQLEDLGAKLEAGEIDALISADVPKCFLEHSPHVSRLFPDSQSVERDYFKRTGIFPIMHTVVIRKDLLKQHPGLASVVYKAFCDAKDVTEKGYAFKKIFNNMDVMIPWLSNLLDSNTNLMGKDWWPYGVAANRKTIDTFLRYHYEQGLSKRLLTCEDIFVPELLNT
ncbi:MAG: 4,5-dihydroxyphthalate decarboxylase [Hymenobacter sp.]|nr:MAG: 4,5-dihydroxyphthalate decarboxylase [Hymenobacter sp.]